MTSSEIIVAMLQTYLDVVGPAEQGDGSGGADSRYFMQNPLWRKGTYAELHRCLVAMRQEEPVCYWHVAERYLRVTKRVTLGCPGCGQPTREGTRHSHHDGQQTRRFDRGPIVEVRWKSGVNMKVVDEGIEWLVRCHRGAPFLPQELYELIAA